ncbi:MAG: replication initiation protein [Rhodobacteraceae bacterium PARR1]|nr:MAG: replication initiation protein [Rhodobacteraceae bacterium PARR1]
MQRISLTPFGRQPVTHGLLASNARLAAMPDLPPVDKWALLNDLRVARADFGVTDRDLVVLHALLGLLPGKELADGPALILHPSNATLSDRAHGMPESTLRRHLAALVAAGLIARHDSPNGKRYALRDRAGAVIEAFGFDLRPLLSRAAEIAAGAEAQRAADLILRQRRTHLVIRLRDAAKLCDYAAEQGLVVDDLSPRIAALSRSLRRKMALPQIEACLDAAGDILLRLTALVSTETEEMSGNVSRFGRHQSESNTDSLDSEPCLETGRGATGLPDDPTPAPATAVEAKAPSIPLVLVLKACPDLSLYAPDPIRTWRDLVNTAHALRPMIGISPSAWEEAVHLMGQENAALALSGILQRLASIRNPGGYLRALSRQAAEGRFSPGPMLMALLNTAGQKAA